MRSIQFIFFMFLIGGSHSYLHAETFKLPYTNESINIDPQLLRNASGSYVSHALHRSLLFLDENDNLIPDLAEKCVWNKKKILTCTIRKTAKWSNGNDITSHDFKRTFDFILNHENTRKDLLEGLITSNSKNKEKELTITTPNNKTIVFRLDEPNVEFEYKLALTMTAPRTEQLFILDQAYISSGAYKIKSYDKESLKLVLEKNAYFYKPPKTNTIDFIYLSDDSLQIPMFKKKQLDLVRRIPTSQIPLWEEKKEFKSIKVYRFDYFGFDLKRIDLKTRKTLFESLDFKDLQTLLNSVGQPGCFERPDLSKPICIKYESTHENDSKLKDQKYEILLSASGGEDHLRVSEWIKQNWEKKFGLSLSINIMENKAFIEKLRTNIPLFFRKGIPLESPLCFSALKLFDQDNIENINHLSDLKLIALTKTLKTDLKKSHSSTCEEALRYILDQFYIVPTGRFEISMLLRNDFKSLRINKLNIIDFTSI